jgi:hypothetical protein
MEDTITMYRPTGPKELVVFADCMLSIGVYAIRLRVPPGGENTVVLVSDPGLVKLANSFMSFVENYLENSRSILLPKSEAQQMLPGDMFKAARA